MLTFKDLEKEREKQSKQVLNENGEVETLPNDEKARNKKLMIYAGIGAVALIAGYFIYTKVIVKKKSSGGNFGNDSINASFE